MTRRNRTLRLIATLVVLAGTLVSLVAPAIPVQAQDDANPAARPPEFPIEILFEDRYFLFDREIPITTGRAGRGRTAGRPDLLRRDSRGAARPAVRLLASTTRKPSRDISRRFPSGLTELLRRMPALPNHKSLAISRAGKGVYAYAGSEPDVPLDGLASIASTAEGFTVYADAAQQPPLDLLMDTGSDRRPLHPVGRRGSTAGPGRNASISGCAIRVRGRCGGNRGNRHARASRLRGTFPAFGAGRPGRGRRAWTSSTPRSGHASLPIAQRMSDGRVGHRPRPDAAVVAEATPPERRD